MLNPVQVTKIKYRIILKGVFSLISSIFEKKKNEMNLNFPDCILFKPFFLYSYDH